MTIRHLYIYKTVCEELSFTKAARKLFMTQPAVSHVVADLEREAGTLLFDRRARRIFLNERGALLYEKAVRLLAMYESVEHELIGLEEKAALRVGSCITIANYWLPEVAARFRDRYGDMALQVEVDSAEKTMQRLERGEIDLALVEGSFYLDKFECIPFSSYAIIPVCSPACEGTIYAEETPLTVERLSRLPLLLREKGSAVRDVVDGAFLQRELLAAPVWTSVNSQALLNAACAGLGVAFLPEMVAENLVKQGELVRLQVEELNLVNHNYIALHRNSYRTEMMETFASMVIKND